jgi:hypothetical protein
MPSLDMLLHILNGIPPAAVAGALAVAANCTWPLQRGVRTILALQSTSSMLFGLHYLFLGEPVAAAMCAAGMIQAVSAATIASRRLRLGIFAGTILAGLGATIGLYAGAISLLAEAGGLFSAFGRLQRGAQAIRWCFLASEVFWVSHNIMAGSVYALTSDTLAVSMLLLGLWRNRSRGAALFGLWLPRAGQAGAAQPA